MPVTGLEQRVTDLEAKVAALESQVADLEQQMLRVTDHYHSTAGTPVAGFHPVDSGRHTPNE